MTTSCEPVDADVLLCGSRVAEYPFAAPQNIGVACLQISMCGPGLICRHINEKRMISRLARVTMILSADGKTRTVTTTGVDAKGQKVNNVAVFERQ